VAGATVNEQATFSRDPVASKQKVDNSVFENIKFDDTAKFKLDDRRAMIGNLRYVQSTLLWSLSSGIKFIISRFVTLHWLTQSS